MKRIFGKILKKLVPYRYYKLIANGFCIVPKYYVSYINDLEKYFDLSLEDSEEKDILLLRKFGHILDKGLHREDATPGHSKAIYLELSKLVSKLQSTVYAGDSTYVWAVSKLRKYEDLQSNPEIFENYNGDNSESSVSYDDLFALIKSRRSNRVFRKEVIGIDKIEMLEVVVNWAASSCNKQPIRLFVTNNPDLSKKCLRCCKGGTGFGDFIPSFWVFTANCRGYIWPSEMYLPTLDCSLGAQNVFLAAKTLGITGTILSWAQKDEDEERNLRNLLSIPEDQIIIFCAVMGYAEKFFVTPSRKQIF